MTGDRHSSSRFQLYGRRKGPRLRPHHVGLLGQLLPKIRIDLSDANLADPKKLFAANIDQLWLEVGFGSGEHLAWQARSNPEVGLIGCEAFINGIAKLLSTIEADELDNIRIYDGDARELLAGFADGAIGRVFLLYPDPWPKRRHHKRRFINQHNLTEIHRIMKPGGELRIASDIPDYICWTLFEVRQHGGFEWLAEAPDDWRTRPGDWPATRYETKAIRENRTPCYLKFRRPPLRSI